MYPLISVCDSLAHSAWHFWSSHVQLLVSPELLHVESVHSAPTLALAPSTSLTMLKSTLALVEKVVLVQASVPLSCAVLHSEVTPQSTPPPSSLVQAAWCGAEET